MTMIKRILASLRWFVRGVGGNDYRALCKRCGRTGQAHWGIAGCRQFKL